MKNHKYYWIKTGLQILGILCCIFLIIHFLTGCGTGQKSDSAQTEIVEWSRIQKMGSMELRYAKQFQVDFMSTYNSDATDPESVYSLITIADNYRYLLVPEELPVPEGLEEDIVVIKKPADHIYLAASSAMDCFKKLDALNQISMTGTKAEDWSIPEIRELVEDGTIAYGGKYNAPDYEMILSRGCELAIESTMIFHNPEVKEELESLGIPVLVDYSSYEEDPLGRVEWIRLYSLLCGKYQEAAQFMEECSQIYDEVQSECENLEQKKTVAFFYISSNNYANVRKPGDYISKMIKLAGGTYVFENLMVEEKNAMSTMNLEMESFYEQAVDADILIYNSTIDGEVHSIKELVEKCPLLADFQAVKNGNCWCTGKNMYQETTGTAWMLNDFYQVIQEKDGELRYLYKLE